ETGRAAPSREMVLILARALEVPFREVNRLLEAAGFARHYAERALSEAESRLASEAIDLILSRQEPYPAVVMDRHWNIVRGNAGADRLFGFLLEGSPLRAATPPNVLRLMLHPEGLRRYVSAWPAVAGQLMRRVHREAVGGWLDDGMRSLLDEL